MSLFDADKLVSWLTTKPADGKFDYLSTWNCALAQYLKFSGIKQPVCGGDYWTFVSSTGQRVHGGDFPLWLAVITVQSTTFGEMLEKIEKRRQDDDRRNERRNNARRVRGMAEEQTV